MPYIKQDDRQALDLHDVQPYTVGELNYVITGILNRWIREHGGPGYATYNSIVGVLECAKLEFYRRACAPYEDTKILANGDVY
jgi:hypothetical protein